MFKYLNYNAMIDLINNIIYNSLCAVNALNKKRLSQALIVFDFLHLVSIFVFPFFNVVFAFINV